MRLVVCEGATSCTCMSNSSSAIPQRVQQVRRRLLITVVLVVLFLPLHSFTISLTVGTTNMKWSTRTNALFHRVGTATTIRAQLLSRNTPHVNHRSLIAADSAQQAARKRGISWMSQESDFIAQQKQISKQYSMDLTSTKSLQNDIPNAFLQHQRMVFDDMAQTFAAGTTIPEDLIPVYQAMVHHIILSHHPCRNQSEPKVTKVLDVACGTGALWSFLLHAADQMDHTLDITGVDLSPAMVAEAKVHAKTLLVTHNIDSSTTEHSIQVYESDILQFTNPNETELYNLIVVNACFGNFWNQSAVIKHLTDLLCLGGTLCITHPLGSAFVEKLHKEDPSTVPHLLPTTRKEWNHLSLQQPLQLTNFMDPIIPSSNEMAPSNNTFYLATFQKVRARLLPQIIRLRGSVDTGYGRGGKKLGFPTANLPSRLFQDALHNISNGVYFGWAVLEDKHNQKVGRNTMHKAVVNVGLSPTFVGQENPEKIVEAHLIFQDGNKLPLDPPDFYHETMRLELIGCLRPEIKFPSFPDLIAQIRQDVMDAAAALGQDPYSEFAKGDIFLLADADMEWVGASGGNMSASWEFQDIQQAWNEVQ